MKEIDIKHACSFTGHRPERLEKFTEEEVKLWLEYQIEESIKKGYTDFITGMQRGVDIWAAEIVLEFQKTYPKIKLFAASAFSGMENRWEIDWQKRYHKILKAAYDYIYVSNKHGRKAFFDRNQWMVDHSSLLIAVYTGAPGGTLETIKYARNNNREVVITDEKKTNLCRCFRI